MLFNGCYLYVLNISQTDASNTIARCKYLVNKFQNTLAYCLKIALLRK